MTCAERRRHGQAVEESVSDTVIANATDAIQIPGGNGGNDVIVLITGASGGLGEVLGRTLTEKGATVYGTMRNPDSKKHDAPFVMLPMEVTDSASVGRCIGEVLQREGRIDAVVNCVNQMFIGSAEEQTIEEVRSLYDTNVFGVMEVCKQVTPIMRKQGKGTIINMSSLGGLLAVPYMSAYTSAKFALEAFSEALYHELKPDDIDVVIMQPVAMKMDRPAAGSHLRTVENVGAGSFSHKMVSQMARDTAASKLTPEIVADKIYAVLSSKKKPLRVPMDRARPLTLIKRLAPQSVIDRMIAGLMKGANRDE
ncbi:MAG: SDR family NAD(P)-dependent oxidoreductase [Deltaproteobacteria bacterium]|nr:SDR family NAD(P)-dependent oxidoreductase [Deltaproteobacteria bacterium]MBW2394211.1 SDR family NAD(P)-dependent oxidoreductase [Deltaproteobacteria bacterium]